MTPSTAVARAIRIVAVKDAKVGTKETLKESLLRYNLFFESIECRPIHGLETQSLSVGHFPGSFWHGSVGTRTIH
jgi:hypothetical protein